MNSSIRKKLHLMKSYQHWVLSKKVLMVTLLCSILQLTAFNMKAQDAAGSSDATSKVTGTITDDKGEAIIGASVKVKNQKTATITDIDGKFSIVVASDAVLSVSYIGYLTQEVAVKGQKNLTIVLQEDNKMLGEVVVVGYGTQKKVNMTGSVGTIDAKALAARPTSNMAKSIQGTVPGVTVISRPGSTPSINIRGRGNLGTSSPLYIVDGVEVTADYFNAMDPTTVESMSFLKDAASAAIYGAKAAFGVVLVTTKSAKTGQMQITYDGSYGAQTPTYMPKVVNSADYAEMYRTAERNSGVTEGNLTFNDAMIAKYRDGSDRDLFPNTNWFDEVLNKNSVFTKHNLSFMGGSDKVKYVLGLGYVRDETLTPGEGTDRYSIASKTSAEIKSWLTVTSNINIIYDKYNRDNGGVSFVEFLRVPPTQTARHSNGNWGAIRNGREATNSEINANPLRNYEEGGRSNSNNKRLYTSLAAEIRPMKDLKITNQIAFNTTDYRGFSFLNRLDGVQSFVNPSAGIITGTARDLNQMDMNWRSSEKVVYDGWLNYDKTFNEKHAVTVVAGIHADNYIYKNLYVGRKDFASNDMGAIDGGSTDQNNQVTTTGGVQEESMNSYFGRLGYVYDQKYMLEMNARGDASSRFAKSGRWGFFPSFSAGWRLDQEEWLSDNSWLDGLKLRASWGQNGNINNVGLYDTYSTYSTSSTVVIGGQILPNLVEGRISNSNLTWETTATSNIGVDFNVKNGLFGMTLDVYNRLTSDILIRANDVMNETGLTTDQVPARNVGSVRNSGFELGLTHKNKIGDFGYGIGFNSTFNTNEIIDLGDKVDELPPNGYWIMRKGGSIGDFYMLQANGLYSEEDITSGNYVPLGAQKPMAGMIKYVDQLTEDTNGDGIFDKADGVINDKDRTVVGNDVPRFTYGINIELTYKNFTFTAMGQGVTGAKVYFDCEASQAFFDNSVPREWQKNNWTPSNPNAEYPKLFVPSNTNFKYNTRMSSFWLFDASYFRIKNMTLSYNIPAKLYKAAGINNVRVFATGDNLITIRADKRMKDFDPEASSGRGYAIGMQTLTGGVSVTF